VCAEASAVLVFHKASCRTLAGFLSLVSAVVRSIVAICSKKVSSCLLSARLGGGFLL
jgi:hypothetical protein